VNFGKYQLLDRISYGGMAEVFRATTSGAAGFERTVAIKLLLPNVAMDQEFITMLIDEAKIAGQLSHANIAQIFDLGMAEGRYYIVQEYVPGYDLRALLKFLGKTGRRLSIAQACHIILKVCEGLEYAHNKRDPQGEPLNLVHRDVSPQNVLVSYEGEVKLIDFGIAKAEGRSTRTLAGLVKGKFAYMSPEQIRGLPVDRRSDVFATGIVLHELLTSKPLFRRKSEFETLKRARSGVIDPPSALNPEVPAALDEIVLRSLARHVEDRYQSAVDLRDALWEFSRGSGHFYSRNELAAWMAEELAGEDVAAAAEGSDLYSELQLGGSDPDAGTDSHPTVVDLFEDRDFAERSGEVRALASSDPGQDEDLDAPSVEIAPEALTLEERPTDPGDQAPRLSRRVTSQVGPVDPVRLDEQLPTELARPGAGRRTILAASAPVPAPAVSPASSDPSPPLPVARPSSYAPLPAARPSSSPPPSLLPPHRGRPSSMSSGPAMPRPPSAELRSGRIQNISRGPVRDLSGPLLYPPAPPREPAPRRGRAARWPVLLAILVLGGAAAVTIVLAVTG
jgi:serine/threonine-protein kinase